jgi:hypothetical protein
MTAFLQRPWMRGGFAAASCAVVVGGAALFGADDGHPAQDVKLLSGAAWLASGRVGQMSLLDGSSTEVAAQVQVASAGSVVDVVQAGPHAYAVDQSTRTIRRIDGATFQVSPPEAPIGDAQAMTAFAGSGKLYVVDTRRGLIVNADPATGRALTRPRNFVAQIAPNTTGIDSDGRLWIADNATGDVLTVEDGESAEPMRGITKPGRSIMTISNGKPVIIDPDGHQVLIVDPAAREVQTKIGLDLRPGEDIQVSGSSHGDRTYIVASRGVLTICELEKQSCAEAVGLSEGKLGAAVEAGNRLFVPDYTTGRVWIVDLAKRTVVGQPQVLKTGKEFQLLTRDGVVFFNDRESELAGVIRLDGGVENVAKYDAKDPDKGLNTPITGLPQPPDPQPPNNPPPPQPPTQGPLPPNQPAPPTTTTQLPVPPQNPRQPQDPAQPPPPPPPPDHPPPPPVTEDLVLTITMSKATPVVDEDVTLKVADAKGAAPTEAHWAFGDTTTASGALAAHRWAKVGTFQVTVQVTMPGGKTGTASRTVEVTKKPDVTVPDVKGKVEPAAQQTLEALGFRVTFVRMPSHTVPTEVVYGQTPASGAKAPPGSVVTLQSSTGDAAKIDLQALGPQAVWTSTSGPLTWGVGTEHGYAVPRSNYLAEDGRRVTAIETHPDGAGWTEGTYTLPRPVVAGDHFRSTVGFGYVDPYAGAATFTVSVVKANGSTVQVAKVTDTMIDRVMRNIDVNLTAHAGATKIKIRVNKDDIPNQDWAIWVGPRIEG